MNIGIVTAWCARGAAYVSKQYVQALEREHNVFIYARGEGTSAADPLWQSPNVTFGAEPVYPDATSVDLDDFDCWITANQIGMVVFNEQWWWEPVILCARRQVRTAAYLVEYREPEIPFFELYDVLIAHSRQHRDTFPSHRNLCFLPWGTAIDVGREPSSRPVREGQVVFLNSAGMNPDRKGTDVVLEAYAKALEHGLDNTKLAIHSQRPLLEYGWRDARTAGLLKDLLGRGRVEVVERSFVNPRDVYDFGDICLYPARFDGMGLTIAEANACALPVITADHAPWNEFVTSENGSLIGCTRVYKTERSFHPFVEPDADALAAEIVRWSRRDIAAAKSAAREYARRHFDWETNAAPLGRLLESAPLLEKAAAIRAAAEYEKSRRRTVREKISFSLPSVVKTARRSYRLAAGRS